LALARACSTLFGFELTAFLDFFRIVSGHRSEDSEKNKLDEWVLVVIAGSLGLLLTLLVNVGLTFYLSIKRHVT
jgi:hypothetical protein